MLFNSLPFLIFFLFYISLIYFLKNQWKVITIVFSIFFYSYWNIYFCFLLVGEALFTWQIGNLIQKDNKYKKKILILGLTIPLLVLFIFKYFNFFIDDIFKINLQNTILANIILPIGISFYTFQAIMYLVDVYKKKIQDISLQNFLVFFLFFPNLIAGPLVSPKSFLPQLKKEIVFIPKKIKSAILIILWGYFLKLCISNNISIYVDKVYSNITDVNSPTLITASIFYSFLIYADFAGYSLIAIGIAKIVGLNVPANFKTPYFSKNLTEFWRRWHISLSKFLRDYLYIPLGGNKQGLFSTCKNILIVMLLGGLWHGASYNFIIWGALHGLYLSIEKINNKFFNVDIKVKFFKRIYIFILVTLIFIPFGLSSFENLSLYLNTINLNEIFIFSQVIEKFYVIKIILLILILLILEILINRKNFIFLRDNQFLFGFAITMILLLIICFANFNETSFIYFQF